MNNNTEVKLSEIEIADLKDITKAYGSEELDIIIKEIPDDYLWDELLRRDKVIYEKISCIEEALSVSLDSLHPIPARAWKEIRTRYEDLQSKFKKIEKGFNK